VEVRGRVYEIKQIKRDLNGITPLWSMYTPKSKFLLLMPFWNHNTKNIELPYDEPKNATRKEATGNWGLGQALQISVALDNWGQGY